MDSRFGNQTSMSRNLDQWKLIKWKRVEGTVRKLQEKIFQVAQRQEWSKVKDLQKLLVRSNSS